VGRDWPSGARIGLIPSHFTSAPGRPSRSRRRLATPSAWCVVALWVPRWRHFDEQRQRDLIVAHVGRRRLHAKGMPCASVSTCRLQPAFARPSGSPRVAPKTARTAGAVDHGPFEIEAPALPSCVRSSTCNFDHTASSVHSEIGASRCCHCRSPFRSATPARNTRPEHKHDTGECLAIRHPWPPTLG